jgi:hypothetical protein
VTTHSCNWSSEPDSKLAGEALVSFAGELHQEQGESRRTRAAASLFLYYGNSRRGVGSMLWPLVEFGEYEAPPFYNVVQSITDTLTNHVVRNKVRPLFTPDGGDVELRESATGMQLAVEAGFIEFQVWGQLGQYVALDGHLHDAGCVKALPDFENGRMVCERVFPWEVLVPEAEARLGNPRQFIHRTLVPKSVLKSMFPEHEEAIDKAASATPEWGYEGMSEGMRAELVEVVDGYHLPSGAVDLRKDEVYGLKKTEDGVEFDSSIESGHDGRQIIAIKGVTLRDRPWPYPYPPFAFYRPHPDAIGFWSTPIPETLAGAQIELIKIGKRVSALLHLHAVPRIVVHRQAKIAKSQITNDYATILESSTPPGGAIQYLHPHAVPGELLSREQELISWCERLVGLSEMSIAAAKPAGIDHAPGMEFLADHESLRHTIRQRQWNDFHIQLARLFVDGYSQLSRADRNFTVQWSDSREMKRLKWSDYEIDRYRYNLKCWDTNVLAQTPAARLQQVMQLMKMNLATPTMVADAMGDSPDFRALVGDVTAMQKNVHAKLSKALKEGYSEDVAPHPYMDLADCKRIAREKINELEAQGVDDEKLEPLRKFWEHANKLEQTAQANAAKVAQGIDPNAPAPGGAPQLPPANGGAAPIAA